MTSPSVYLLTPLERIRTLMTVDFLRGLSPEEISLLAQNCEEHVWSKGETLTHPGSPLRSFHIVVEGQVLVEGAEHREAMLGPGRTVGLLTMLGRLPNGLQVVARTEVRTLDMSTEVLAEVMEDRVSILLHLIRHITRETLALRRKIPDGTRLGGDPLLAELVRAEPIGLVSRLRFLQRGSIFRRAGVGTLVQMATSMEDRRFPAGHQLWEAGEPAGFFYLVVSGTVRCQQPGGACFFATAGYPLGNLESQAAEPRWYTAVTETPMIALRGEIEGFRDVLEDNVDVAMDFLGQVALGRISVGREPKAAPGPVRLPNPPA